ncbi:hypothetical protein [Pedococcus soli]
MNGAPSSLVSPGLWGFFAFFLLGLALYLLMRNMNARMRRMSYRSEELAREAEQERAADRERKGTGSTPTEGGQGAEGDAGRANGPASGESPSAEPQQ